MADIMRSLSRGMLEVLLVTVMVFAAFPSVGVSANGEVVDLVLLSDNTTVANGETFDIIVQVQCNGQPVHGVDAFIDFDAAYIQVQSVADGATFGAALWTDTNNTAGEIGYGAGAPEGASGNFTLATITFQAISRTPSTNIDFHTVLSRK